MLRTRENDVLDRFQQDPSCWGVVPRVLFYVLLVWPLKLQLAVLLRSLIATQIPPLTITSFAAPIPPQIRR